MILMSMAASFRDPTGEEQRLLASLAASQRIVLTSDGRAAFLADNGQLTVLEGDPPDFIQPLLAAKLVDNAETQPGPRREVARFIRAALQGPGAAEHLPEVVSSARLPCFVRREDRLVYAPVGYSALDRAYFAPARGLVSVDVDPTYPHLHALFGGITFAQPFHRANLLGALCAAFARPAIAAFPILLFESDAKSSGKTSTADAFGRVLTGRGPEGLTFASAEDDMERKLGHLAGRPGPNYVLIDNVRAKRGVSSAIRSQFLSSATAGHVAGVRALYKGTVPIFDPVIACTMNHARVESDLADKVVRFPLRRPGNGSHRKLDPFPPKYAATYRHHLVAEVCHILAQLDLLQVPTFHTRFYEFEQVAVLAARQLGLEACFDPAQCLTADAVIVELAHIVADPAYSPTRSLPGKRVVEIAEASQNVGELREALRACPNASQAGRAKHFFDDLERHFPHREVQVEGVVGKLVLDRGPDGQYTVSFKETS